MSLVIISVAAVVSSVFGGGQLSGVGVAYDATLLAHKNGGCCLESEGSVKAALLEGIHVAIQRVQFPSPVRIQLEDGILAAQLQQAASAPSSEALQAAATSAGLEERLVGPIMGIFEGRTEQGEPRVSFVGASFELRQRTGLESARQAAIRRTALLPLTIRSTSPAVSRLGSLSSSTFLAASSSPRVRLFRSSRSRLHLSAQKWLRALRRLLCLATANGRLLVTIHASLLRWHLANRASSSAASGHVLTFNAMEAARGPPSCLLTITSHLRPLLHDYRSHLCGNGNRRSPGGWPRQRLSRRLPRVALGGSQHFRLDAWLDDPSCLALEGVLTALARAFEGLPILIQLDNAAAVVELQQATHSRSPQGQGGGGGGGVVRGSEDGLAAWHH